MSVTQILLYNAVIARVFSGNVTSRVLRAQNPYEIMNRSDFVNNRAEQA